MESEHLKTNDEVQAYESAVTRFLARTDISARNKDTVMRYLRDAGLGKTSRHGARKKVGMMRRVDYVNSLLALMLFAQKDLEQVSQEDMEAFIEALESGKIRSRRMFRRGGVCHVEGTPLSPAYAADMKINIRRFYRYLLGGGASYPPLVDWFDVRMPKKKTSALSPQEVQAMIDRARTPRDRALIQVLFDSGFRLGELINVRLKHVTFRKVDGEQRCFFLETPYSKTIPRTVVLPMPESMKWLTLWLEDHPGRPTIAEDGSLRTADPSMQLFPMKPDAIAQFFSKHGPAAIDKHVYPHLMRHTSATYWANKLSYFQLCRRFGWTMTSRCAQTYVDAAGIDELHTVRAFHKDHQREVDEQVELKQRLMRAMQSVLEAQAEASRAVPEASRSREQVVTTGGQRVR